MRAWPSRRMERDGIHARFGRMGGVRACVVWRRRAYGAGTELCSSGSMPVSEVLRRWPEVCPCAVCGSSLSVISREGRHVTSVEVVAVYVVWDVCVWIAWR